MTFKRRLKSHFLTWYFSSAAFKFVLVA